MKKRARERGEDGNVYQDRENRWRVRVAREKRVDKPLPRIIHKIFSSGKLL